MSQQPRERNMPSHTIINDRYPHGIAEKVTADGVWLKGGTRWYHFNRDMMKGRTLPKIGAYVVMTEDKNGQITHVATQHELQLPPEQPNKHTASSEVGPRNDPRISDTDEAYFQHLARGDAKVEYPLRIEALALAVQLLNLELKTGIDRDDIYRVAQDIIRWVKNGEGK